MNIDKVYGTIDEAMLLPKIIEIAPNLYAACFFLMKLLPAKYILDRARREGTLKSGDVVIESTSGTFGLALAILCNRFGYKLILVSDPVVDASLKRRMEDLGAVVDIVDKPEKIGGIQGARLNRLQKYKDLHPNHFWPAQYSNPNNPSAYAVFAEQLMSLIGPIDCLVGTVGSGGSMCGSTRYLRNINSELYTIGIDTHNSVLFGRPDGTRTVRGLGNSLLPKNLDHRVFDEIHWLNATECFMATRFLHKNHGLFMGPTSGAAYHVAKEYHNRNPQEKVVFICADEGYRYLDTVYSNEWLIENKMYSESITAIPDKVSGPSQATESWSYVQWSRRTLEEVVVDKTLEAAVCT